MTAPVRRGHLLRRSPLTGTVYLVTRWRELDNGVIQATAKTDVTSEFDALVADRLAALERVAEAARAYYEHEQAEPEKVGDYGEWLEWEHRLYELEAALADALADLDGKQR